MVRDCERDEEGGKREMRGVRGEREEMREGSVRDGWRVRYR